MKTPLALILPAFFSCTLTLGCGSTEVELDDRGELDSEPTGEGDETFRAAPTDACIDARQIAIKTNGGPCPAIGGWAASKLFPASAGGLDDFCRYDWVGMGPPLPGAIGADPNIAAHEADCEIVHAQGSDALSADYAPLLESMFLETVNAPSPADLNLPASGLSRRPVTLAVVDTAPSGALNPRSIHSGSMVQVAESIACPSGSGGCAVATTEVLGMPRYSVGGPADTTRGGHFGSLGDLASGIHQAVLDWELSNVGAIIPSKLIVNLSLGWEQTFFGSGPAEQAVHAAIEEVYCKGGIIIAAAGNCSEMCTSDALLPGAWETALVPDHARCDALIPGSAQPSTSGYRPLVYAVGGVEHNGAPIAKARPNGIPRLNATADHGVAGSAPVPLTGTSISAAAVSGTAALLWSYLHDTEPGEIMDAIYASGPVLGGSADFVGIGASDIQRRKLDACSALQQACLAAGTCPIMPMHCLGAIPTTTFADLLLAANAIGPAGITSVAFDDPETCSDVCSTPHSAYFGDIPGSAAAACPPEHDPVDMFVSPQPTQPSCPNCTLQLSGGGDASLYITLDSDWSGMELADMYVTMFDGSGYHSYYLGAPTIDSSHWYEIKIEDKVPSAVSSATVMMYFKSGERSLSSLLIG